MYVVLIDILPSQLRPLVNRISCKVNGMYHLEKPCHLCRVALCFANLDDADRKCVLNKQVT